MHAGVTQLVECHLAKVDVESSNLFSRSNGIAHLVTRWAFLWLENLGTPSSTRSRECVRDGIYMLM
jgi:hypothetical protein